jgi:hypothetical protein
MDKRSKFVGSAMVHEAFGVSHLLAQGPDSRLKMHEQLTRTVDHGSTVRVSAKQTPVRS